MLASVPLVAAFATALAAATSATTSAFTAATSAPTAIAPFCPRRCGSPRLLVFDPPPSPPSLPFPPCLALPRSIAQLAG